jgi:gliding motility-associated-like protein
MDNFSITSNSSSNSTCEPNPVKLTVNSVSGFSYAWKKNTDPYPAPSSVNTYDAFTDGSYYVQVSNSSLGCPAKEIGPVKVAILTAPVANFTIGDPKCANAPIKFKNTSTIDADADGATPIAPVIYKWSFDDGKTSTDKNPTNTYASAASTYNVTLLVSYTGVTGCTSSKSIPLTITSTTLPAISASATSICPGESSTLAVTPTYSSITWDHGANGTPITIDQPGTYTLKATDVNGCIVPRSIIIDSKEVPQLIVSATPPIIPVGQSSQLMAEGAHTFVWSPAESLSDANTQSPVATPVSTTIYTVVGSFTDGCSAQAQVTVSVDGSEINIDPPLAFSPNGDTSNDLWIIAGIETYSDCTMNIFDSRGKRIYQKKGYTNDWDGTYQGKPVPGGTYYYVFGCPGANPKTGSLLVFR